MRGRQRKICTAAGCTKKYHSAMQLRKRWSVHGAKRELTNDESRVLSDQNSNRLQLILDPTSLPQEPPSWDKNEEDF